MITKAIREAISKDEVDVLKEGYENGEVDLVDMMLWVSVMHEHKAYSCARYALSQGSGNFSFADREIPVIAAFKAKSLELLKFVVECGAALNQQDKYMNHILCHLVDAVMEEPLRNQMAEVLIMAGSNPTFELTGKKLNGFKHAALANKPEFAKVMRTFWDSYSMAKQVGALGNPGVARRKARL